MGYNKGIPYPLNNNNNGLLVMTLRLCYQAWSRSTVSQIHSGLGVWGQF